MPSSRVYARSRSRIVVTAYAALAISAVGFAAFVDANHSSSSASEVDSGARPAGAQLLGWWVGKTQPRSRNGGQRPYVQQLAIWSLAEDKQAGMAAAILDSGRICSGSLTYLDFVDRRAVFRYEESNDERCISRSRISVAFSGDGTLDYREQLREKEIRGTMNRFPSLVPARDLRADPRR